MNEYTILHTACAAFIFCVIASWFYGLGGRANKWLRRYIASVVITLGFNLCAVWLGRWDWWMPYIYPIFILDYTMGYAGGSPQHERILKRVLITILLCLLGVGICFLRHIPLGLANVALGIQFWIGLTTVVFAVKNPYAAAFEEPFICLITTAPIMGYLFI